MFESLWLYIYIYIFIYFSQSGCLLEHEESQIHDRTRELNIKGEMIAQKEKIIQDNSHTITSLQNEISSLQVTLSMRCSHH